MYIERDRVVVYEKLELVVCIYLYFIQFENQV